MDSNISYNELLYRKRMEMKLSKRKFAKFLDIPPLFYSYYERGYVKPSKKYVEKISKALGIDYSQYLDGINSYPTPLPEKSSWFEKFYRKLVGRLATKIIFVVLLIASAITCAFGFYKYNYTMNHAEEFYNEKYLNFVYTMREKGGSTFSLLHELVRPEIHNDEEGKYVSISASNENHSLRSLNAYINYHNSEESLYYIIPNDAQTALTKVNVTYIDCNTLVQYSSSFTRNDTKSQFVFSELITNDKDTAVEQGDLFNKLKDKFATHINDLNTEFTSLIKNKLGLDYNFYDELLVDHSTSASNNLVYEISYLAVGIGGTILVGLFLFLLLFALFFGITKKKEKAGKEEVAVIKEIPVPKCRSLKSIKKDIRFFPFIPETIFEIAGILLVLLGSVRIVLYVYLLFESNTSNQAVFDVVNAKLFTYFTLGMFLLYFIDFDVFLDDSRSLRNFFLYAIIFIGLYVIEATLMEYLAETRGVIRIVNYFYTIPNNFSTISCYFGIMVFLFYNPKWANTKKKRAIFRSLSILPIAWIIASSLIFENYKSWGLSFNTWQIYFFNAERPQFSLLCVTYLVGLYFLRKHYKRKYGEEYASRYFNGNKFYFQKNILVCVIIAILALDEFLLNNTFKGNKSLGGYWQIIFLVPFLLFYHPHFGKRSKPLDYFTLGLYGLCFGIGYFIAFLLVLSLLRVF